MFAWFPFWLVPLLARLSGLVRFIGWLHWFPYWLLDLVVLAGWLIGWKVGCWLAS